MIYKSYSQFREDISYISGLGDEGPRYIRHRYNDDSAYSTIIEEKTISRIKKEWILHIQDKFEDTKKSASTTLGRFLKIYPLEFKEFCCLMVLIGKDSSHFSMFSMEEDDADESPFAKYKINYESSQLKRFKLVFKIVNPLTPLKTNYEISYRAQLALKGKKYTQEYEQLDMALEEESKRSSPDALDSLYYAIEPKSKFEDLIVCDKLKESLKSAIARDSQKEKIFKKWGFKNVLEYGQGTTLNFRGPPGTGKTLAANVVANELGKKLLMVRYDQLQNKYVGETEKHIQRLFTLAKKKNAVLFFDEADAIALNRATLTQSWEMSQVNTLLKELERFDGVCIFATNFAQKYDPAFERRLTMHIDFIMPDKDQCKIILNKLIPQKARDRSFSLESLNLEGFSGGDLKNVALNSAGIAAKKNSDKICSNDVEDAVNMARESKKNKNNGGFYLG